MRWTEEEYQVFINKKQGKNKAVKKAKNKYSNKKITVDSVTFDSKKEARRYVELKILQMIGAIEKLELQPRFELQPEFVKNDEKHKKIEYIADFKYFNKETNEIVVEDVKGHKTQVYRIKKKLFEYKYPELTINEIEEVGG
jgi:hypothetical protein